MAELLEEIKKLGDDLKGRLEKAEGQTKESGKLAEDLKGEMQGMASKQRELLDQLAKQQADIDGMASAMKRQGVAGGQIAGKSLYSVLAEKLAKARKDNGNILAGMKQANGIMVDPEENFRSDTKAVGDMTIGANVTGNLFIQPQVLSTVQTPPSEEHIRQYITTGSTTSNLVRYIQLTRGEGGFGMVGEAELKPQMDYDLSLVDAPVRKIAGHIRISDEMLDDIPFVATLLATIGMEDLKLTEDSQVLYGSGTGNNLKGISQFAQAFNPGTFRVTTPNLWDILVAMRLQIRKLKYRATTAFVSPTVYAQMRVAKDTQNRYLFPALQTSPNGSFSVDGVSVVENVAIADGDIIMGNFTGGGAILLDRQQANIKYSDQDRDNFIRNMVTIVLEERLALPVPQPLSFVKTTVAAATAALTAA